MGFFSYLDTVTEDAERIRKARDRINITSAVMLIEFLIFILIGFYLMYNEISGYYFFYIFSLMPLIIGVSLVIKRELFSIMIFLKEEGK